MTAKLELNGGGEERRRKPILCLDFDGVLHSYISGWQGISKIPDPPVAGFAAFLERAVQVFNVVVFSSRSASAEGRGAMRNWLERSLTDYYRTNFPVRWSPLWVTDLLLEIGFPAEKPAAFVSLDDRAVTFTGTWPEVEKLLRFAPWHQTRDFDHAAARLPLLPARDPADPPLPEEAA